MHYQRQLRCAHYPNGAALKVADTTLDELEPAPGTLYTETAYDGLGRVVFSNTPDTVGFLQTSYTYESPHVTTTTRPRGNATRRTIDWRGELTKVEHLEISGLVQSSYDARLLLR